MTPIDLSLTTVAMVIFAGIASITSPCVLPVVPIIVAGTEKDHKYRPLLIVLGLSISFIAMGVITSLFGGAIAGVIPIIEKAAGTIILLFGLLMLLDINLFKKFTLFSNIKTGSQGRWSGLIMGLTLGLVWIPCVGPMLSGVLALVATDGRLSSGLILLALYSLGFAIPMLLLGYASQSVRQRIKQVNAHPLAIRLVSGGLLIAFGIYILTQGMLGF
ncbi:MAG: cytochrome c biogenesis CcdA family protein [Deltaproteobacteria bacterium]|jgi:cytochrome c-type biogenesis protein|nr:cytochrome c biogenesis CcdA family protein [Deltaproteobacteria bacterium]MCW8893852.1 cytochrome c biogenesis CcdA family protein [Deltaproteobacteria bacterium]MCW9048868.1 cytochrome c biogenesis CcdA family protein [Deltaproteobacteria bacterium]